MDSNYIFGIGAIMTIAAFALVIKPVSTNKPLRILFWILGNIIFIGTIIYWSQEGHHSMKFAGCMLLFMNASIWVQIKKGSNKKINV